MKFEKLGKKIEKKSGNPERIKKSCLVPSELYTNGTSLVD